jgi:integrase
MRTKLPANVTREKTRHGKWVCYYRVGKGKRTRLPDFGSDDFEEAYQAARQGKPQPKRRSVRGEEGTLAWLVTEYKKTAHFRGLDVITQRRRDSFYRQMVEQSGDALIADIVEQDISDGVEERATVGKGHSANNFLKAVRPLFAYAKRRGWVEVDPAKSVAAAQVIAGSHAAWTIEEVVRYEQRHPVGTMANLALRILLFTGLRRSDAVQLGRQHIRKGVVRFTPGKTIGSSGVEVIFTALPPLLEAIAATKSDNLTFLVTEHGHPFASGNSFGNKLADWCGQAGVKKSAHGLRKLGPSIAADNSATAHELMAMWGWSTLEQAQLYTKAADRQRMGEAAAAKLQAGYDELIGNNTPRTFDDGAGIEQNIK